VPDHVNTWRGRNQWNKIWYSGSIDPYQIHFTYSWNRTYYLL